jgi:DUF4097 and DUF4098 domain-containing protein YvlB
MIRMFLLGALALSPQQTDTTFAVRAGGTVDIENFSGRVTVRSWDQARMRVRAQHPANVEIEIESEASGVRIDASSWRGNARDVAFDITVPRRFGVDIEGVMLEVDVQGLEGDLSVETVQGAIRIQDVAGDISASSTDGLITVTDTRGHLEVESVNEGIRITNHQGEASAEAVNGPVTLTGMRATQVVVESMNGEIRFAGEIAAGGRYQLESHNGDLTVEVPRGTNASVSIDTYNGEIEADFPIQLRSTRNRKSVTFDIGAGGARLELSSFGGAIRLRTAAAGGR